MKKISPQKVRWLQFGLLIAAIIVMLTGFSRDTALYLYIGLGLVVVSFVVRFVCFRCPHCGKFLDRNWGDHCQFCGKKF